MNINMLEYLAAIEQYGSLSEAARHLYVSQPYLSRLVRQAEQEYGLTIFTRGREGLCPTEQGRLFLQMARDLAAQAQQFRRTFQAAGGAASLRGWAMRNSPPCRWCSRCTPARPIWAFCF